MDGSDEGAHGWVSVNYLLGNLGGRPEKTVSVVDLGADRRKIASLGGLSRPKEAPDGYVRTIQATSSKYSTYVHSFKGYGLVAVRAKIFNEGKNEDGSRTVSAHRFRGFVRKGLPVASSPERRTRRWDRETGATL